MFAKMHRMNEEVNEMKDSQSYMYQITINSPKEKKLTHERILKIFRNNFETLVYLCMADEQGSCYHTHVFVVFSSRVRFSMVKRYFKEAHIEKCKGTVSDNVNYVKKSGKWKLDKSKQEKKIEGTFEEHGSQPPDSKGRRGDMSELYQMINDGLTNSEILAENQDYIMQIDKIDKVRTTLLMDKYKDVLRLDLQVVYISGATGTGKTRGVFESNGYANVFRVSDYDHPFDGYSGQDVIFFDEFRSSIRLKDMLLYLDIYPIELPCRYANKYACFNKVYIVSNWTLEQQYSDIQHQDRESWKAFLRRIHKVITYETNGIITEYDSIEDYLNRKMSFEMIEDDYDVPFDRRE